MDVEQLKDDVRSGRIGVEQLVEFIAKLAQRVSELEKKLADAGRADATKKFDEAFSMRAEEKRQIGRGKIKPRQKKPLRRGRVTTAEKLKQATATEDCFPVDVAKDDCQFSHARPVWRLRDGRAVLVAYQIYRGPKNQYGKIPGVLGRTEFGLEILVTLTYLVYVVGLSFDKACGVLGFFQQLQLTKSQADKLLTQLSKHWEGEFERLCTLLANSAVVHADETSWSLKSVWTFLSEQARVQFFGVNKDAATLKKILDAESFTGLLCSDDAAVYTNFTHAQKCWAHLLRKAFKLTLLAPDNVEYRRVADRLLEIYRAACRVQRDGRLGDTGRARKANELYDQVTELCWPMWKEEFPQLDGPDDDYRLLCNELMRLMIAKELFAFVTAAPIATPLGEKILAPGTNNAAEQSLRAPASARDTGRTNKSPSGARRQSILSSVLDSLRCYLPTFTLATVLAEIDRWSATGISCFAQQLRHLGLKEPTHSVLNSVFPEPSG